MDNRKYLIDKYSNGKEVKDPNFRQYFTFDELVDLLDSYQAEQLILSGVSDIVHRAELKVLENVSDYIPCEIYSQAIIFSQKKRDNVR